MYKTHQNAKEFPKVYSPGGGEIKVETAGYMTTKQKIENMIYAGQRLIMARQEQYDFLDDVIDEDFYDPTRDKGFDLADASMIKNSLEAKAKAVKASQKAQDASGEAVKEGGEQSPPKGEKTPLEGQ